MAIFEKILVPLDGSDHSLRALEKAIKIAQKFDGKVTLIHVYSISYLALTATQVTSFVEAVRKSGEAILAEGEKIAKAQKVKVEKKLKEGAVVEEILKTTRKENFDLIVIGARGISKIKELLLGSISHGVTIHAPCPVLIVK